MHLQPGTPFGPYRIVDLIGAGGMGEVYRGHDPRLNRDVALKILRPDLAADADRLQRFVREAQTLAALNHPHIAHIHGVEDAPAGEGGELIRALVMEFVDGEELSARLARGRLPLDEALEIARQIAEALEFAHEQGVVHRDLKPANIKIRADGTVKVLDFGLAKALGPTSASTSAPLADSPTFTSPAVTAANVILGTAAYMSPEQARGKTVDRRADIWAFGVVLYEMLAGRLAFTGDTVTDLLAAVVTRDPDWSALPDHVPHSVRGLLQRCLEREPRNRLRDIGEARILLSRPHGKEEPLPATPQAPPTVLRRAAPWAIAALAAAAAAWLWMAQPIPDATLRKLELNIPGDASAPTVTLSPDGRHIVYRTADRIVATDLERLQTTELVTSPPAQRAALFWSPDSVFVGYNDADAKLWIVPVAGGLPRQVARIPETGQLLGATWTEKGVITFAVWRGGLYSVPASGGEPTQSMAIDPKQEIDFHLPLTLPDGRILVGTHLLPRPSGGDAFRMEAIGDGRRETALGSGFLPIGHANGHLLLLRFDTNPGLWALPYSGRLPWRVEDAFLVAPGAAYPTAADDGSVLYSLAPDAPKLGELVWVDREGRVLSSIGSEHEDLVIPSLSADGRRVAFSARTRGNADIWVRDLQSQVETRVTTDSADQGWPAWFPSGQRLAYSEIGSGSLNRIVASHSDGSGGRSELTNGLSPEVSPDGRLLVYVVDERGESHLRISEVSQQGEAAAGVPFFKRTPEPSVHGAAFSPDGRYLSYVEQAPGGALELFVTSVPGGEGRWPVFVGARSPVWSASGELFFTGGSNDGPKTLMSATIGRGNPPRIGTPIKLFDVPPDIELTPRGISFDASADGTRFLMVRSRATASSRSTARWVLVQNWLSEFQPRH